MDWFSVEKNLSKVSSFLKNNLDLSPFSQNNPIKCEDCLFRLVSTLIASNKISVIKISYKNNSLWKTKNKISYKKDYKKNHGAHWHNNQISLIENYFLNK